MLKNISFILYAITALLSFTFGLIYLIKDRFMSYHSAAVEKSWNQLDSKFQTLILALLKVCGGGMICNALAITTLLIFSFHSRWANFALLLISLSETIPTFIANMIVKLRTKASPPWLITLITIILIIIAFILGI